MGETANTFVWEIGDFQDYVKRISNGDSFTSPKFWMPKKCDDTQPTLWRLHLYPNGDLGADDHISVSLEAIRTPFEKLNDINKREQRHKLGIGRSIVKSSTSSKKSFRINMIIISMFHLRLGIKKNSFHWTKFFPVKIDPDQRIFLFKSRLSISMKVLKSITIRVYTRNPRNFLVMIV